MDIRSVTSDAIILRGRDYSEADRILILLTKEAGKMPAIAKSVRKPASKLKASTQLFSYSRLNINKSKRSTLGVITQGETVSSMMGLREDLTKIACASYVGEMIDLTVPDYKPNGQIFLLTLTVLSLLEKTDDPYIILRFFDMRLLSVLGYRPRLDACLKCGRSSRNSDFILSPYRGGIICKSCQSTEKGMPVSGAAIAVMDKLLNWDLRQLFGLRLSENLKNELDRALFYYMDYHLEKSAKARDALQQYL
ncbi:MAG: DNA repair protein RecO [Bacillota bacterium]|jgi:DNA repair protein RecO (recombination protein O)